jgi:uncharacterized damage-inducible protein DinB
MANALTPLFEHNYWANLLLLEACSGLKEEQLAVTIAGVYGTPAATLVHYLSGEQTYIRRLSGEEQPQSLRGDAGWPGLEALVEHARWSGDRLRRLAETIDQPRSSARAGTASTTRSTGRSCWSRRSTIRRSTGRTS